MRVGRRRPAGGRTIEMLMCEYDLLVQYSSIQLHAPPPLGRRTTVQVAPIRMDFPPVGPQNCLRVLSLLSAAPLGWLAGWLLAGRNEKSNPLFWQICCIASATPARAQNGIPGASVVE